MNKKTRLWLVVVACTVLTVLLWLLLGEIIGNRWPWSDWVRVAPPMTPQPVKVLPGSPAPIEIPPYILEKLTVEPIEESP